MDHCPVRIILDRLGDKWSMLVISILNEAGTLRFNELNRSIADISQKMLTTTLRSLEADGLVERKVFAEVPPRVEYSLTARGKTLVPHIDGLVQWALSNFDEIMTSRKAFA
ncbi:MAG TPA: transcriptional regulator [Balneolaceae bacterium]|nr:transcriptional regulator [Balneolaceae bacterium]